MRVTEVANRYAKALFEIASETKNTDTYNAELRAIEEVFNADESLQQFVLSPLVQSSEKENALEKAFEKANASQEIRNFFLLLAQKGRLPIMHDVVVAFRNHMDSAAGVTRGTVKTAHTLGGADQKEVTDLLGKLTNSEVVLDFGEDENLVGGLTAQVGSLTIDDSIQSHLNKMRDELNRSVH